jgi:hypothetical protein
VTRFTKSSADTTITDTTYDADEHRIWCTCEMSAGARDVLRPRRQWDGWDIEQISSAVRDLPRERARWLLEDHLGSDARQAFLGPEGDLSIAPAAWWFERHDADEARLPTDQPQQFESCYSRDGRG